MATPSELLAFLIPGFLVTITIETPILLLLLTARHNWRDRITAGVLLTACTYPIVVLVMPQLLWQFFGHTIYIAIAETFAPTAECAIFYFAWIRPTQPPPHTRDTLQDFAAITIANLTSWLGGSYLVETYLKDFF
jgi:hypothetical protein